MATAASRTVPRWALVPALSAPVLVVGGWTWAARGIPGFDSARNTVSDLTRPDAPHRTFLAVALVVLGLCYVALALALRPAALPGRLVLAFGGLVSAAVAAFPDPARGVDPTGQQHSRLAGAGFVALAVWPLLAVRRHARAGALGLVVGISATAVMAAEVVAFQRTLGRPDLFEGGIERLCALTQALWVLAVVLILRSTREAEG